MENSRLTPNEVLREWLKLRVGIAPIAEQMGKTRGTVHNWLQEDMKPQRLQLILDSAQKEGILETELKALLISMGQDPSKFNIQSTTILADGDTINIDLSNSPTITVDSETHAKLLKTIREQEMKIVSLEAQVEAYKEMIQNLSK